MGGLIAALSFIKFYDTKTSESEGIYLGGEFSNQKVSDIYLLNETTNDVDTVYFKTNKPNTPKTALTSLLHTRDCFENKAQTLDETLQPGMKLKLRHDKSNNVYKILSKEPAYTKKELDDLATL